MTDSRALCALKTASNLAGKLARWSFFLEEFQLNIVHKAGATLQNADGLSRCAQEGDSPEDLAIKLDNMAELEEMLELEAHMDDIELMMCEAVEEKKLECEAMSLNVLAKLTSSYPCSKCGHTVGESKHKQCGSCGEVVHVSCLPGKVPVGYWFCKDCAPGLEHGHMDPALDIPLHNLIRGGERYPDSTEEMRRDLKGRFSFVRGCLIEKRTTGDVIIPPPCLRADIVAKVHEELMHTGWEKVGHVIRRTYSWPSMLADVRALCRACLSCQLSTGVFRRKDTLAEHLKADNPRDAWSLDLAPGLKLPDGRRANIVVCVDDFSKFAILGVLAQRTAADLRDWFLTHVLGPYGRPLQVRTDRGNEFAGQFTALLKENNVKHVLIRPHAPWTNGRAERMVRTVKDCIRRVLHQYQG